MPRRPRSLRECPANAKRVLVLQGGGALGSYQAGAYDALCTHEFDPTWVAGISIGAINAAIIAGNPKEQRVARLKEFWELVSSPVLWRPIVKGDQTRSAFNEASAAWIAAFGVPGFFTPRVPPAPLWPRGTPQAISYYDTAPLRETLTRLVDFDLVNEKHVRLSVGAVNVRTGNFAYFDNANEKIGPEHIMASGALPPGFPPVEIDGEHYWDGGLVSNTPLDYVLDQEKIEDLLDLPGRPVQRPRPAAGLDPRGAGAREGHPLLQPHAADHRRQQEAAQHPQGAARADRAAARRPQGRSAGRDAVGSGQGKHRHGDPPDLQERKSSSPARRTTTSRASACSSTGAPARRMCASRCSIPNASQQPQPGETMVAYDLTGDGRQRHPEQTKEGASSG